MRPQALPDQTIQPAAITNSRDGETLAAASKQTCSSGQIQCLFYIHGAAGQDHRTTQGALFYGTVLMEVGGSLRAHRSWHDCLFPV